jgi:hypothetical protein
MQDSYMARLPDVSGVSQEFLSIDCTYGQIMKHYVGEPAIGAARRYSPGYVVSAETAAVVGRPSRFRPASLAHNPRDGAERDRPYLVHWRVDRCGSCG